MIGFIVTFGLAALIVVVGMRASLRLHVPSMPRRRSLNGLRSLNWTPMVYVTPKKIRKFDEAMSNYPRKAFVFSILILVVLSVIVIHIISLAVH